MRLLLPLLCFLLFSSNTLASSPKVAPHIDVDNPPILSLQKIKRGQKGIGYTVFASARGPEEFGFEILGIMRGYLGPGEDLIIAKLTGDQIERTGVISGMSGSPAYIDGKLIGAVGYRFGSFTKDAIAGITPIERMLAVSDDNPALASPTSGAPAQTQQTPWGQAEPISTPIIQSGLHPNVIEAFAPYLKKRGMWPLLPAAAKSGSHVGKNANKNKRTRFFAGGPIAGLMVDGDVSMAGIGTVTWVHHNRFLAFGHPFQGIGTTHMPVSNAEIVTTVASASGSWKMGQATTPVGRLTDDRLHAIAGNMYQFAETISVDVSLHLGGSRKNKDARKKLHYTVMRHPSDSPLFIAIALANAIESRISTEVGGTLELHGSVLLSTGDRVKLFERSAHKFGTPGVPAAISLLNQLSEITEQGFQKVRIKNVNISLTRRPKVLRDVIIGVRALTPLYPGATATVAVQINHFESTSTSLSLKIKLPKGLIPGRYTLVAASPRRAQRLKKEAGLIPAATNLNEHLQNIAHREKAGTLSLFLVQEGKGLFLGGRGLHALPPSYRGFLDESGGFSGRELETHASMLTQVQLPSVLQGKAHGSVILGPPPQH